MPRQHFSQNYAATPVREFTTFPYAQRYNNDS